MPRSGRLAMSIAATVVLAACGGAEGSGDPEATPTIEIGTPSPSAGGAEDAEQAIEQTLRGYLRASDLERGKVTDRLLKVATEDWAEEFMGNYRENVLDAGNVQVGRGRLVAVESVEVEDSAATAVVCVDNGPVVIVEQGGEIDSGTTGGLRLINEFRLVQDAGTWKVDGVEGGQQTC